MIHPPIAYTFPLKEETVKWSRGLGTGANEIHWSDSGSYISLAFVLISRKFFLFAPPIAKSFPSTTPAAKVPRGVRIEVFCDHWFELGS